ncbi:MAG: hypothetical protein AB7O66_08435 [Limisphaerales bacterium]
MRTFLLRVAGFLTLQLALAGALIGMRDGSTSRNYLAEAVPKHRLLESTQSPKVVLVGGSSMAFGIRSDRLEAALGRPVVNMGLASGLGLEFMLAEVEPRMRAGDTVILGFEYDHFARGPRTGWKSGTGFDPEILAQVLVFRPAGIAHLGWRHARSMILERGLPILSQILRESAADLVSTETRSPTTSEDRGFNRWGDHLLPESMDGTPGSLRLSLVADERGFPNEAAVRSVRDFVQRMKSIGVTVLWSHPPKPAAALTPGPLHRLGSALREIPGLEVMDTPEEHGYPEAWFHGSPNHLTSRGADARTDRWIARLTGGIDSGTRFRFLAPRNRSTVPP